MDQAEEICKRLELGEPLSRICKDKSMPDTSTVYRHCREDEELQKKIMNARQTGVFTLLDQISEDMQIPKTPQETHFLREKWSHIRWLATKLASNTFGEKSKQEVKQDHGGDRAMIKKIYYKLKKLLSKWISKIQRSYQQLIDKMNLF